MYWIEEVEEWLWPASSNAGGKDSSRSGRDAIKF